MGRPYTSEHSVGLQKERRVNHVGYSKSVPPSYKAVAAAKNDLEKLNWSQTLKFLQPYVNRAPPPQILLPK